jgi:hypothetical protein
LHPSPVCEGYDSDCSTSRLPSMSVARHVSVGVCRMRKQRNRCFPTKAVAIWRDLDDKGHVQLVKHYLQEAGNFRNVRSLDRSPRRLFSDPLYAVIGVSTGPYINDETGEV